MLRISRREYSAWKGMVIAMGTSVGRILSLNADSMSVELRNRDGSYAGTLTVSTGRSRSASRSGKTSAKKKYKKLQYNFKRLSNQILRTKTPASAKQLVTKAKFQIADLKMKMVSGDYDYTEIHSALVHAEKIARVAKKRLKNLQQEENIEQTGRQGMTDPEEMRTEKDEEDEILDTTGMSQEELQKLAEQIEEVMDELEKELEEAMKSEEDLMQEYFQTNSGPMEPGDLELLKKKHRSDEMRDIMKADMEYLKALFNKLAKEKESAANGSYNTSNDSESDNTLSLTGVSLEIGGSEIPVAETAEPAAETAGANVDVTV